LKISNLVKLHIVSFDIPYPPNYGGAIDVFYKLKTLSEIGVSITLHTFEYKKERQDELLKYCDKVFYYSRNSIVRSLISTLPFIVKSRANLLLISNLKKDTVPILFEGLHTTYPLLYEDFSNRKIFVRMHNIEDDYYNGLAKSETNQAKKAFFKSESRKIKNYEPILTKADFILAISPNETAYFKKKFKEKVVFIPPFHQFKDVLDLSSKGDFALYHGDLRISDNKRAAEFLLEVFTEINYPLVLAASFLPKELKSKIDLETNVSFVNITKDGVLDSLFERAQLHVLPTFQKTGIKLKLINSIYAGRFVVANDAMLAQTGLEEICVQADSKEDMRKAIRKIISLDYSKKEIDLKKRLIQKFDTKKSAKKIIDLL